MAVNDGAADSTEWTRRASHAGTWYTADGAVLDKQLSTWLNEAEVKDEVGNDVSTTTTRAADGAAAHQESSREYRAIIAPHAGLSYSGSTAAYAYRRLYSRLLSLSQPQAEAKCKPEPEPREMPTSPPPLCTHSAAASAAEQPQLIRIFVLGPSHHVYLAGCALSQASHYATPLGQLVVDTSVVSGLMVHQDSTDDDADGYADADAPLFELMSTRVDEAEHSIELHLPYIAKIVNDLRAKFAASEESESALPRPSSAERNAPPTLTQSPPEMIAAAATAAAAGPSPTPSTVGDATTDRKRRRNEGDEDQSAFARPRPRSAADHRRLSARRELQITIVPVLVGSLTAKMQSRYGKVCGVI